MQPHVIQLLGALQHQAEKKRSMARRRWKGKGKEKKEGKNGKPKSPLSVVLQEDQTTTFKSHIDKGLEAKRGPKDQVLI